MTLVAEGQPRGVIVVTADAAGAVSTIGLEQANARKLSDKVAWAARDLQEYLEKMSGAKLPVVGDNGSIPAGVRILVGRSALTAKYDQGICSGLTNLRKEEGYAIITDGETLVLAGNDEGPYHGSEYAVSFFGHRLGVRWYMPGDFGEVVPARPTITVGPIDEVSRPDFVRVCSSTCRKRKTSDRFTDDRTMPVPQSAILDIDRHPSFVWWFQAAWNCRMLLG